MLRLPRATWYSHSMLTMQKTVAAILRRSPRKRRWRADGILYALVQPSAEVAAGPKQAVEQASVGARSAAAKPAGISLAVLPFVNLSSDKEQEFFSDGMTEEITAALAKVPDLKVVARTSAFEFKGKNVGVDKIGQQLHATHLIEGSVRKAGDKPRHHGPTYQGR
jgi:hypothetical protein